MSLYLNDKNFPKPSPLYNLYSFSIFLSKEGAPGIILKAPLTAAFVPLLIRVMPRIAPKNSPTGRESSLKLVARVCPTRDAPPAAQISSPANSTTTFGIY